MSQSLKVIVSVVLKEDLLQVADLSLQIPQIAYHSQFHPYFQILKKTDKSNSSRQFKPGRFESGSVTIPALYLVIVT